jgi:hypothetical protein
MHPVPPYGRDFWPRTRRIEVQADFDYDRPCGNCGYNLRGLPISASCPECGSSGGITVADETIPWDEQANLVSFIGTILLVMFRPRAFGKLSWSPEHFDMRAARRFRRWTILVAMVWLCFVTEQITAATVGFAAAMWAFPFQAASVFLWLNSVSLAPIMFIKGTASPVVRRAEVVSHYTSSLLALAPLHALLLPFSLRLIPQIPQAGWFIASGLHFVLLLFQLLLSVNATACMFYELVQVSRSRALGYTLMEAMGTVGAALPMLIGIPALAAVASKALAG